MGWETIEYILSNNTTPQQLLQHEFPFNKVVFHSDHILLIINERDKGSQPSSHLL